MILFSKQLLVKFFGVFISVILSVLLIKFLGKDEFEAIPYRYGEIMKPILDNSIIRSLGWSPRYTYKEGIKETLKNLI